jgi:hypothetical protein
VGGVQQIQMTTEDRENGDLGAVAPLSEVLEAAVIWYKKFHFIQQNFLNFWYFKTTHFGSAVSKRRNFGGGG